MAEGRFTEFTLAKVIQLVKQKSLMPDSRVYSFHHPLGCIFLDQDKLPPMKVSMFVNHKSQCSTWQDETIAQQRCEQTDSSSRTSPPLLPYGFPMVLFLALISKHTADLKDTQWQGHYSFWKCPDWLPSLLLSFLVGHIEAQTLVRRTCWSDHTWFSCPFWGLSKPSERHHLMYHAPTI